MKTKHVDLGPLPNNLSTIAEQRRQFSLHKLDNGIVFSVWPHKVG
jgi:hypothetical protein